MKELRAKALEIYKMTVLESWVTGLLTGLLITGIICLGFLVPGINAILVPFVCLPILFAAHYSHLGVHLNQRLTFGNTVRQFFAYFRPPFNSSFGVIIAILKSLLVFVVTETFLSFFGVQITYLINPGITNSIEAVQTYLFESEEMMAYEDLINLFALNNNALLIYMCVVALPAFILAVGFFIYNICRNSIGIYLRFNIDNPNTQYIKMVMNHAHRMFRKKMFTSWMGLNWPIILLYFLGSIGATIAMAFFTVNPLTIMTASIAGGTLLISFFLPFYLPNMEAMYDTFAPIYHASSLAVNDMIKKTAEENARRAQEEKEFFEKMIRDMENAQEEESKDKEKDPTDGSN